jgi:hypothetical protein
LLLLLPLLLLLLLLLLPGCSLTSLFAALYTAIATAAAHTPVSTICPLTLCLLRPPRAQTMHDSSSADSISSSVEQLLYARPLIRGFAGSNSSQDGMHHCRHVSIPYKRPQGHLPCGRRQQLLLLLLVVAAAGRLCAVVRAA